jgi:hypothetical protein
MTKLEDFETIQEAAARLNIDERQVRRYAKEGRLGKSCKAAPRLWLIDKQAWPTPTSHMGRPPNWAKGKPVF